MNEAMIDARFNDDAMEFMTDKRAAVVRLQLWMLTGLLQSIIQSRRIGTVEPVIWVHNCQYTMYREKTSKNNSLSSTGREVEIPILVSEIGQISLPNLVWKCWLGMNAPIAMLLSSGV